MVKMTTVEKLGFLYVTLADFALGMVVTVDMIYFDFLHPVIFLLSGILLGLILLINVFIFRMGLDVLFKKKEATT